MQNAATKVQHSLERKNLQGFNIVTGCGGWLTEMTQDPTNL